MIETFSSGIYTHALVLKSIMRASLMERTISNAHIVTQLSLVLLISQVDLLFSSDERSL